MDPSKKQITNQTPSVEASDRRVSERIPPKAEPTYVWVSVDERIRTRMLDLSDGGISVMAPRTFYFEVGYQIRVEVAARYRMATIAYVDHYDDEHVRLGLSWIE